MIGGLGLFFSFAVSLGVFSLIAFLGAGDVGGALASAIIIILSIVLSPILATIVGAIIGNNYDNGITAIWNGALVGAIGTTIMVVISILVLLVQVIIAGQNDSDDDSSGPSSDDISELLKLGGAVLAPAAIGGALGAFIGCTFLESGEVSTRLSSRSGTSASFGTKRWQGGHQTLTKQSAPIFASGQTQTTILCPGCGSNMTVPKLGQLQKVKCDSCGMEGEIEI